MEKGEWKPETLMAYTHPLCTGNASDCLFEIRSFREGEMLENKMLSINHLVFCVEGHVRISSTLFQDERLCEGEVMLVPHSCECLGVAMSHVTILIHQFNNTVCDARKCILHYLSIHHHKNIQGYCSRLKMHPLLWRAVEGIINYITHQATDKEIWELKHRELIWIFTNYYSLEEMQAFFHPISGEHVSFRTLVTTHYPKANNTEQLARLCCMGLTTFRRAFKKEFNKPVYAWLTEKRCEGIVFKLSVEYIPFTDIIDEYNFSSAQHFSTFCKRYLGDTPGNLRKRMVESRT